MSRTADQSRELKAFAPALILLAICALINYVDRGNLSIAAPLLKDELRISVTQLGLLLSAFFWTYTAMQFVNEFLTGYSAAAGIALINSVGNLGGFAGPYTIGRIATRTGNFYAGLAIAGVALFISAILVLLLSSTARAISAVRNAEADLQRDA
jgi:MFS family permease